MDDEYMNECTVSPEIFDYLQKSEYIQRMKEEIPSSNYKIGQDNRVKGQKFLKNNEDNSGISITSSQQTAASIFSMGIVLLKFITNMKTVSSKNIDNGKSGLYVKGGFQEKYLQDELLPYLKEVIKDSKFRSGMNLYNLIEECLCLIPEDRITIKNLEFFISEFDSIYVVVSK